MVKENNRKREIALKVEDLRKQAGIKKNPTHDFEGITTDN
jgi:hypothetical protein